VTLNVLDKELARLDAMDESKIVEHWNLIDWRKRRNAVLNAIDKLSSKKNYREPCIFSNFGKGNKQLRCKDSKAQSIL